MCRKKYFKNFSAQKSELNVEINHVGVKKIIQALRPPKGAGENARASPLRAPFHQASTPATRRSRHEKKYTLKWSRESKSLHPRASFEYKKGSTRHMLKGTRWRLARIKHHIRDAQPFLNKFKCTNTNRVQSARIFCATSAMLHT